MRRDSDPACSRATAASVNRATVRSRFAETALAVLDNQTLACRQAAVWHGIVVKHLEIRLPAAGRHDVAHVAALVVDELGVRLLLHARLEGVVDVEAVSVRGDRGPDELDPDRR